MRKTLLAAILLVLAVPTPAAAGRFALGVEHGFSAERTAQRVEARTGLRADVLGPFALAVTAPSARGLARVDGVSYVERIDTKRRLAFVPNDPLAGRQWHLVRVRAFEAWLKPPALANVRVAIIDSGIDADHPDLERNILDGRSFVGSSWRRDTSGHGTFVAGEIAAEVNNGTGVAGMGISAQLLIAKVVRSDDTITPEAEARAIRWAVARGARVINVSFGGTRDPDDPSQDTYSRLEAAAVEYAVANGVLVVAAVGNGDKAPSEPWQFASYPAALPHVLGVSAVRRDGTVPDFSNRDEVFNDIAAPGDEIFSTLPEALTADRLTCALQGYSDCGPAQFRRGEGTSFAAPQVAAAGALIMGVRPLLQPDQVAAILTRSAVDATPARGCRRCGPGRDAYTGWGVLDVQAAVASLVTPDPPADRLEPNDDAGKRAPKLWASRQRQLSATVDYWDDPIDVYRVYLRKGQRLRTVLRGPRGVESDLKLWTPGTRRVEGIAVNARRLAARDESGAIKRIRYRAPRTGWYFLEVELTAQASGRYSLRVFKTRAAPAVRRPGRRGSSAQGSPPRRPAALRP